MKITLEFETEEEKATYGPRFDVPIVNDILEFALTGRATLMRLCIFLGSRSFSEVLSNKSKEETKEN